MAVTRAKPRKSRKGRREKTVLTFQVIVEQDEDGYFVAECPALRACYTQARTYERAIENIKDVIEMCLDELGQNGDPPPTQSEIIGIKRVEVQV